MIQVASMIQLVAACIGFCLQLTNLANGYWWTINYMETAFSGTSILYSVVFIIGVIQKKISRATRKDIIHFQFSFWGLRCRTV